MSEVTPLVTAAEIARLTGVTRATVSNWRRRYPDFPAPAGGSESRPLFDLPRVQQWIREHGLAPAESPVRELRAMLHTRVAPDDIAVLIEVLPGIVAGKVPDRAVLQDDDLVRALRAAIRDETPERILDLLAERGLGETAKTGAYATPPPVARLMVELLSVDGKPPAEVLDPACGSGTLLRVAAEAGAKACYGQDVHRLQAVRAEALLSMVAPTAESTIRLGDSLTGDAFSGLEVDAVVTNPPYGVRDWGADEVALDPRWEYGAPSRYESEMAWVQHALAHLRPGGVAVLLLPPSVAMRAAGRKIRTNLLRAGALRAVIGLPAGAAPPRQVALQLWVLRRPVDGEPQPEDLLLMDTARLDDDARAGGTWDRLAHTVLAAWHAYARGEIQAATVPDVAAVVRVMDVLGEEVDLTPARYVRAPVDADRAVAQAERAFDDLSGYLAVLRSAADNLRDLSALQGLTWRTATVGDLVNGGALRVLTRPLGADAEPAEDELGLPVLRSADVASASAPSEIVDDSWSTAIIRIEPGDVVLQESRSHRGNAPVGVVAQDDWVGAVLGPGLFVLRVDPQRLDPWFVAGFTGSPENSGALMGATVVRVVPNRLRIPLLPLPAQQRYGAAFRLLHELHASGRRTAELADRIGELVHTGLTAGALEPPAIPSKGRK
ncbi:N-6 DNA methylase [Nocardia puris]|uniref:Type I restriction-modification system DNA methylase subunit n=1 Tax=Nocardia puris TaxID=208602 RepID=A0A366DQV9_9NOCA|nr:N-6 DNA methylase [Nocardia puris]RBO92483.1 type I restriction-modification system DNA methylase subunit [Nocardia puris]